MTYANVIPLSVAEEFLKIAKYVPETGELVWTKASKRKKIGGRVGNVYRGYLFSRFQGLHYAVHRMIWTIVNWQEIPKELFIDHIDGDPMNNRAENLRPVTNKGNCQNRRKPRAGSRSGYLGVTTGRKCLTVAITVDGKTNHIGRFPIGKEKEAHEAYVEAKRLLHPTCTL